MDGKIKNSRIGGARGLSLTDVMTLSHRKKDYLARRWLARLSESVHTPANQNEDLRSDDFQLSFVGENDDLLKYFELS